MRRPPEYKSTVPGGRRITAPAMVFRALTEANAATKD